MWVCAKAIREAGRVDVQPLQPYHGSCAVRFWCGHVQLEMLCLHEGLTLQICGTYKLVYIVQLFGQAKRGECDGEEEEWRGVGGCCGHAGEEGRQVRWSSTGQGFDASGTQGNCIQRGKSQEPQGVGRLIEQAN